MSQTISSKISSNITYIVSKELTYDVENKKTAERYKIEILMNHEYKTITSVIFMDEDGQVFTDKSEDSLGKKINEAKFTSSDCAGSGIQIEDDFKRGQTTVLLRLSAEVIEEIREYVIPTFVL